jgi:hypothetical protein
MEYSLGRGQGARLCLYWRQMILLTFFPIIFTKLWGFGQVVKFW